ncbi:MAG: hypothetical protein C0436_05550 [Alphaproteobacteria bacterium]|nr:hypothetical protein [Alphaproteobacteria bacterium]
MGGGGSNTATTTQKADPWSGTQPHLLNVYGRAQTAADRTSTAAYDGNFVTPGNAQQQRAINETTNLAESFRGIGNSTINMGQATADGAYLNANNYLLPAMQQSVLPIMQQTFDMTMPQIGSAAQEAGAFGGSRHALMERYALKDMNQQVANTISNMFNTNYQNERTLQQNAPGLIQQGMTMNTATPELLANAGTQQYNLDNLQTQNALMRFQDSINAPWRAVMPYTNILSGVGMPGGTSTMTTPQGSAAQGAVGGAMGGGMLGYMASGGNPYWTLGGAAAGGGAGMMR